MKIVVIGLSITSSWGNGHATTYRALLRALASRGHDIVFLERDVPWYAGQRDLAEPSYCRVVLYREVDQLEMRHAATIQAADAVIVGSYVPDGVAVIDLVLRRANGCVAFYDVDTPVTLAALQQHQASYIHERQIPRFDLYLSFTGGPTLVRLEQEFGARRARALYCAVDPELYRPLAVEPCHDLTYLGTYSPDRQPTLDALLMEPARTWPQGRFAVAGPQYPETVDFPANVARLVHVAPGEHAAFYGASRFTLNVTRQDMRRAGYAPSVRLFEAAACGTPVISDTWPGLADLFTPGEEILLADDSRQVLSYLTEWPEARRRALGARARARVLREHTSSHRAEELERHLGDAAGRSIGATTVAAADARPA
jgi:spore maturation protein CgeB